MFCRCVSRRYSSSYLAIARLLTALQVSVQPGSYRFLFFPHLIWCGGFCPAVGWSLFRFTPQKVNMEPRVSWVLLGLLVLALLVGTLVPDVLRSGVVQALHAPSWVSSVGHFVLFAAMAMLLAARPLVWPAARIVLVLLGLALLTEGLQFLTTDRHPRWLDVGIDMVGALVGLGLIYGGVVCRVRR